LNYAPFIRNKECKSKSILRPLLYLFLHQSTTNRLPLEV